ncbi:MAG: ABC transporter permease [Pseudomonadota bacterium]|nr:ABC transporter permease [Pseudomonadota bacterium]
MFDFRLEQRRFISPWLIVFAPVGAVMFSFLVASILILLAGANPLESYFKLFLGAFGSKNALAETLTRSTPIILTGLAAAIAFRAKFWNIGAEGQLYAGALAVTFFGTGLIELPTLLMIPFLFLMGALAGGLLLLPLVLLRNYYRVDEVVTTLLTNFIIVLLVGYLLEGPWKDPMALGWPQGESVIDEGILPQIVSRTRLHLGFIISIGTAMIIWLLLSKTVLGYRIKAVGINPAASHHAGVPVVKTVIIVALLSGGMAGMAGVTETAGLKGYLTLDLSPGFGYAGIAVAMLAGLHPIGVIFSGIFLASIYVGADAMSRAVNVPTYLADVIVALTVLFVLFSIVILKFRIVFGGVKP